MPFNYPADIPSYIVHGGTYQIQNGYDNFSGGFLVASPDGCIANTRAMGKDKDDNTINCVSTLVYDEAKLFSEPDGTVWRIFSATGKELWSPVLINDHTHLQASYVGNQGKAYFGNDGLNVMGGYLNTRGSGCQDNHLCVSTSHRPNRDPGTGPWGTGSWRRGSECRSN